MSKHIGTDKDIYMDEHSISSKARINQFLSIMSTLFPYTKYIKNQNNKNLMEE